MLRAFSEWLHAWSQSFAKKAAEKMRKDPNVSLEDYRRSVAEIEKNEEKFPRDHQGDQAMVEVHLVYKVTGCKSCPFYEENSDMGATWYSCQHNDEDGPYGRSIHGIQQDCPNRAPQWCPLGLQR